VSTVMRQDRLNAHLSMHKVEVLMVALGTGRGTAAATYAVVQIQDDDLLTADRIVQLSPALSVSIK
jgi:hypothetical protein